MNKLILIVCVLALVVSGANTFLLVQMTGKAKDVGQKIDSVSKELEKVQPVLQSLATKAPPGGPPGPGTGEPTPKPPLPVVTDGPEPKGPPKLPAPPGFPK